MWIEWLGKIVIGFLIVGFILAIPLKIIQWFKGK